MVRRRWWETGERSIEDETAAFAAAGLAFQLDQQLLDANQTVVFRGDLRLDDRRVRAEVRYPPAYADDEPVVVYAPTLPVGRHRSRDGLLCLDHPVLGQTSAMGGAEAVARAERLWWLWENDREQLGNEEAAAPDPRANQYDHDPNSAVTLRDVNVSGLSEGHLRINMFTLQPFRGGVTMVTATSPMQRDLGIEGQRAVLAGNLPIGGFWRRVQQPPDGYDAAQVFSWARSTASDLIEKAVGLAQIDRQTRRTNEIPAVVGFVYPDEGPGRGETHDQWLFLVIGHDNSIRLPRPILLRQQERWLRQPQMRPLAAKKVGIVGLGALGSPISAQLARAGVGSHVLVDHDLYLGGNRVRHELDLAEVGNAKVAAMAGHLHRIDPWLDQVAIASTRLGGATSSAAAADVQSLDDRVAEMLSSCDLIINASAHTSTGYHLARLGREIGKDVVHAWVSAGAWGGRVLIQSNDSGCSLCLAWMQAEPIDNVIVPEIANDPEVVEVLELGCGDPTFTGPGFEILDAAAATARIVVQRLLDGDGYPACDFDLATLNFRDLESARPSAVYTRLPKHPNCSICNG